MTQWRDARLQRALDQAPDAQLQPLPRTRDAIRASAHEAVAPASASWWQRLWEASGRRSVWTPALATLLLASLVTVLWRGEPVPDAQPDAVAAKRSAAPAVAPAATTASPPAEETTAAPAPAPAPAATTATATTPASARAPQLARDALPAQASKAQATPAPAANAPAGGGRADVPELRSRQAMGETAARAAPAASDQLAKSAAPLAREERSLADAAAPAAAPAAPAAPAPAPAAAARAPMAAAPAAAPERGGVAGLQAQQLSWEAWTELRIAVGGRAVVLARHRVPLLADLLNRVARTAQSTEPMNQPVRQLYELSSRGTLLGVLEVGDDQVRWLPLGERGPSRTARPDAGTLQALRDQAEAVLPR